MTYREGFGEVVQATWSALFPHRRCAHDSLSCQVESDLVACAGLGSLPCLFVLLRVLLEDTLAESIQELLFLRTKLPVTHQLATMAQ